MKDELLYFRHVRDAIVKIEEYLEGKSYEEFIQNTMLMDAVARELEVIGEAMNNIPKQVKTAHPEIPYPKIISMRNRIIHEYFDLDTKIIWDTYKEALPTLKEQVQKILDEEGGE